LNGELNDSFSEFFVGMQTDSSLNKNIWRNSYYIRETMIPSFISFRLAKKILIIGKSINFMLNYRQLVNPQEKLSKINKKVISIPKSASDNTDAMKSSTLKSVHRSNLLTSQSNLWSKSVENYLSTTVNETNPTELKAALLELRKEGETKLSNIVERISSSIDAKLLNLMVTEFYLLEHLSALKKFMLLGQGDFYVCLMDSIGLELNKQPNKLFRHNLTGILEGCLRASNAQYEPSYILNRVSVRLLDSNPGDTGWEIFTLDYIIDPPLNAVVYFLKFLMYLLFLKTFILGPC
jgi:gamma-tubulin complex component 3